MPIHRHAKPATLLLALLPLLTQAQTPEPDPSDPAATMPAAPLTPASSASAAASTDASLQLYGTLDLALAHFDGIQDPNSHARTTAVTGLSPGSNASSKVGIRGQRPLTPGLRGEFDASVSYCASGYTKGQGVLMGSGLCDAGAVSWRQTFVGVSGDWGRVKLGRLDTLQAIAEGNTDAFGDGTVGAVGNLSLIGARAPGATLGRTNQAVVYEGPAYGGLQGAVLFSNDASTPDTAASQTGGNKPTSISVDLHGQFGASLIGVNVGRFNSVMPLPDDSSNFRDYNLWMAYLSHDLGGPKLGVIAQHGSAPGFSGDQRLLSLGLNWPQGPGTWMASYTLRWDSIGAAAQSLDASTARQFALGYKRDVAKGLTLYAAWARILNDPSGSNALGTSYTVGDASNGFDGVVGQASSGVNLGMTLAF